MSQISKQALAVENTTSFPNNNTGYITPALLRDFNTDMIDSTVNQSQYTSNSGSWNQSISALNTFTSSQQPSFTALNAFTASQLSINSGVNTFTQSANTSINTLDAEVTTLQAFTSSINQIIVNGASIGTSTRFFFNGLVSASIVPNVNGPIASITILTDPSYVTTSSFNAYSASVATSINGISSSLYSVSASQAIWNASATASIQELLNLSSSLSGGYATQGELDYSSSVLQANIDTKLNTSSFNQFTSSTIFGLGFATTGSNVFVGDQFITGTETIADTTGNTVAIQSYSGSLVLTGKTIASGSSTLSNYTSSANQLNLIFKASSTTSDTVISGSNNIIANPNANTAGFRRYLTTGNIGLVATGLPQFSASMGFSPTLSGNYFANTNTFGMTVRGPVSSSAYSITNNGLFGGTISLGTAASTNYERAINGTTITNNIVNGTVNVTAYKTNFISSSTMLIASNNIGGTVSLNADSSSLTLAVNTIQNANLTVNNSYYNASATGGGNSLSMQQGNAIFGSATLLYASGSNTTAATGRQFNANLLAGTFNSASLNLNGDNSNIVATAIIGHNLGVTGSAALQTGAPIRSNTYGSAFFGRFNAQDGNKAKTAETVFAIGTGTTTTPKTAFLIDSGSNTFVEGTLNVSGSLTITGSVYGNVSASSITSQTASIDLSVANYFTLTLSGTTNINVTNPRPGVTATLVITTGASVTASFSSNVKQVSGSSYVPSPSGSTDIISLTSVDSTNVYLVPAYSFV